MAKPEREFFATNTLAFTPCAGNVDTLTESILATDPETGVASSLMRFAPGTDTTPNGVPDARLLGGGVHRRGLDHRSAAE